MEKRTKIILAFIGLLIIGVVVATCPYKYRVEIEEKTSIYQLNNPEHEETVEIYIKGYMYNYLFKTDRFVGQIIFDNMAFTQMEMFDAVFYSGSAAIHYYEVVNGEVQGESLGSLIVGDSFDNFTILIYDKSVENSGWSSKDGYFIALPSDSRDSALSKLKELSSQSSWLSGAKWDDIY